jgi:predicted O-linked N-acetylglucosamine transferase (SPINDLY family)
VIAQVVEKKSIISPFTLLGYSGDPSLQLQCARNYVADRVSSLSPTLWAGETWHHDKVRIAYLSADFHQHATAHLIAELFERHDRSRFEIIGVSFGVDDKSEMRKRLVAAFDQFHDVFRKSDEAVAKLIHDLQIDIAIDLKGYTQDFRFGILAYRPAPIQASYLGFPGTIGAEFIDYIIADRIVAPFEHQAFYTEKIIHLPDCYQVNDTKRKIAERTPTRQEAGLPEKGFVFCCFNNNWKITPDVFSVWMRLLHAIEGSVLWLLSDNKVAERNLRMEAQACGIDPARLVFASRLLLEDHLARHRVADLFLDTLPCNAHTTASDALWAGLPVVTRLGGSFAGRVAASLLNAIGLPELVTYSIEDYEMLALRLANNPWLLEGYRSQLTKNRLTHPLFDTDRFRRHIEAAYLQMWGVWQRGEQPRSFAVEAEPDVKAHHV